MPALKSNFYTVNDLREILGGISRQRVHVLIKAYGVQTERVGRSVLISKREARKIPRDRPTGVHKSQ